MSTGILNQTIVDKSNGLLNSRNEIQETIDIGNAIGENMSSEIAMSLSNPSIGINNKKLVGNGQDCVVKQYRFLCMRCRKIFKSMHFIQVLIIYYRDCLV